MGEGVKLPASGRPMQKTLRIRMLVARVPVTIDSWLMACSYLVPVVRVVLNPDTLQSLGASRPECPRADGRTQRCHAVLRQNLEPGTSM